MLFLWLARSRQGAGSGYPAGERLVPAVMRWLEEHRLPELVLAAVAGDQDVSHAAPAAGSFAGRFTQARFPAHLRLTGPQLVTERAAFGLVLEHRGGHLNDHALTSSYTSTITSRMYRNPQNP
jgi:hypothetical protein